MQRCVERDNLRKCEKNNAQKHPWSFTNDHVPVKGGGHRDTHGTFFLYVHAKDFAPMWTPDVPGIFYGDGTWPDLMTTNRSDSLISMTTASHVTLEHMGHP